jgi:hypothetical protein
VKAFLAGALVAASAAPAVAPRAAAAAAAPPSVREVRTTWTHDFGIDRPGGVTYDPGRRELLVAEAQGSTASVLRLGRDEQPAGLFRMRGVADADTIAFDGAGNEVTAVAGGDLLAASAAAIPAAQPPVARRDVGDLGVGNPSGATFDAAHKRWYLLDAPGQAIVRADKQGTSVGARSRIRLRGLDAGVVLRGLAYNPEDGLLYVAAPDAQLLYGFDAAGNLQKRFSLASVAIGNLRAIAFAPSADRTDRAGKQDLFVADAGTASSLGGVTELTLAAAPLAAAPTQTAALVQVINTALFNPGSPDPSGIAWMPGPDRLEIVDSEVDEVTGAGYHGANMWQLTRAGIQTDSGTLFPTYSKEPTGAAYDPGTNTLFVSDDSKRRIHIIKPGNDNRFGTSDDVVTFINALALGSDDTEDPAFDTVSGHLFFSDAISAEIYDVNPVDGVFGNGNDTVTHFDVGVHGVTDGEGLAFDAVRNTLLVGDRTSRKIYEITKTNSLVRIIDAKVAGLTVLSGLTVAPAIDNPSRRDYWIVSRGVDNGANSNENDGKIFEVSAPVGPTDAPPSVSVTSPAEGATVSGANVSVQATASDDHGVTKVEFFDGTTSLGTDTNGADGWSVTWNTTTGADGPHTIRATATDTVNQTGTDTNNVTVQNVAVDAPPSVSVTSPADGATVSGANVSLQATATDDHGVTKVEFFDGTTSLGTDTNGADGWSVTWNTTAVADGPHTIRATATDTINQTATDTNSVTVDNSAPSVSISSPTAGATVSGVTSVVAVASDPQGLASVTFFVDGTSIGTDTNGTDGWSATWNTIAASNGPHDLTARVTNLAGLATTSSIVTVTVSNTAAPQTLNIALANGNDDVEERQSDGRIDTGSTDLDMLLDNTVVQNAVGLRFLNVAIPRGATITNAYIQFRADETSADTTNVTVNGVASDNAPNWTTVKFSVSNAPRTTASATWAPPPWTERQQGVDQRTTNLSAILQQLVNRPGWAPGNALACVLTGSGRRVAKAFEAGATSAPILHIEYLG